jgi:formamidopyrimidine-DNA glycosylase
MSVELPEAKILAEEMNRELVGKQVKSILLKDCERLQRVGMIDKDISLLNLLVDRKIETVTSRGNVILVKLDSGASIMQLGLCLKKESGLMEKTSSVTCTENREHILQRWDQT